MEDDTEWHSCISSDDTERHSCDISSNSPQSEHIRVTITIITGETIAELDVCHSILAGELKSAACKEASLIASDCHLVVGDKVVDEASPIFKIADSTLQELSCVLVVAHGLRAAVGTACGSLAISKMKESAILSEIITKDSRCRNKIMCMTVDWNTGRVFSGDGNGKLWLGNLYQGILTHEFPCCHRTTGGVTGVAAQWETMRGVSWTHYTGSPEIIVWDLENNVLLHSLIWAEPQCRSTCFAIVELSMCRVFFGGNSAIYGLWGFRNGKIILERQVSMRRGWMECADIDWNAHIAVVGSSYGILYAICFRHTQLDDDSSDEEWECDEVKVGAHEAKVTCLNLAYAEQRLISSADDGTLCVWDLKDRVCLQALKSDDVYRIIDFAVSWDRQQVLAWTTWSQSDNGLHVWSLADGALIHTLRHSDKLMLSWLQVDWCEGYAITNGDHGTVLRWDLSHEAVQELIVIPHSDVTCCVFQQ